MQAPADEQLAVLARVLDILGTLGIGHMISGSIAASYYAQPRMTRDIDIVIDGHGACPTRSSRPSRCWRNSTVRI
jgi:hypothetical protein